MAMSVHGLCNRTQDLDGDSEVDTLYVVTDMHSNYCIPMMVDSVGFKA